MSVHTTAGREAPDKKKNVSAFVNDQQWMKMNYGERRKVGLACSEGVASDSGLACARASGTLSGVDLL